MKRPGFESFVDALREFLGLGPLPPEKAPARLRCGCGRLYRGTRGKCGPCLGWKTNGKGGWKETNP